MPIAKHIANGKQSRHLMGLKTRARDRSEFYCFMIWEELY